MIRSRCVVTVFLIMLAACRGPQTSVEPARPVSSDLLAAEKKLGGARIFGRLGEYIVSSGERYEECLSFMKSGLIQRCELAGDPDSAVIHTTPGLSARFPQFSDLFVNDFGARVPIGPIGSLSSTSIHPLGPATGSTCTINFKPRQPDGPVITKSRIQNLYWGSYWRSRTGVHEMVAQDRAWEAIANDPRYYTLLAQYSLPGQVIGAGTWVGHKPGFDTTVNNPTLANSSFLTEEAIQKELISEIPFTPPDEAKNSIYIIYLPPGASTPRLNGYLGYHFTTTGDAHDPANAASTRAYFYAVIEYQGLTDGTMDFTSANIVESHEIDETITDPTTNQGWRETGSGGFEIGDECTFQPSDFLTYTIQREWDQANCTCGDRVPQPATPIEPVNCRVVVGCNDSVTVLCDMIDEAVLLQRLVTGNWTTVTSDTDLPRFHVPFLFDSPLGDFATYRICGTNSHGDLKCASPTLTTGLPHQVCSPGGGGPHCGGLNQPRCMFPNLN